MLQTFFGRLRLAVRSLLRFPGSTVSACLALAVGIGLCTAMFTVLGAMASGDLPFEDSDRLLLVQKEASVESVWVDGLNYDDRVWLAEHQTSFEQLAGMVGDYLVVSDQDGLPEQVEVGAVTHEFFAALRLAPRLGRAFGPEDDVRGAEQVVLLSHRLWTERYAADPGVLGRAVRVGGTPATVVGVMPPGVDFPWNARAWIPLQHFPTVADSPSGWIYAFGRLRDGVAPDAARQEMAALRAQRAPASRDPDADQRTVLTPLGRAMGHSVWTQAAGALMVAASMLLAVACLNVAHLRLVHGLARRRDLQVRRALGARTRDLVAGQLVEGALVCALGGAAGIALAHGALRLFDRWLQADPDMIWWRYLWSFDLDARALLFTAVACVAATLVSGMLPALDARRLRAEGVLRGRRATDGPGASRAGDGLTILQVAMTFVLLAGALLLLRSFETLREPRLPYDPAEIVTAHVPLPADRFSDVRSRMRFFERLRSDLEQDQAFASASFSHRAGHAASRLAPVTLPGDQVDERLEKGPLVRWEAVLPGYFATLDAQILAGRDFVEADFFEEPAGAAPDGASLVDLQSGDLGDGRAAAATRPGRRVAIVNEGLAERLWPGLDPIGRTFHSGGPPWTVVGVVEDLRMEGVSRRTMAQAGRDGFYVPFPQVAVIDLHLHAALSDLGKTLPMVDIEDRLRRAAGRIDQGVGVFGTKTIATSIFEQSTDRRLLRDLFAVFAAVSMLLAAVGIYGVVSAAVGRRRKEIGVRMALGAASVRILRGVLGLAFGRSLLGLVAGVCGSLFVAKLLASYLVGVAPTDPWTLAATAVLLLAATLAAALAPALRAAGLDPIEVLRDE